MANKNYYQRIFEHYEGNNQINGKMLGTLCDVFSELYENHTPKTKKCVGVILTKAMRARSFTSFEKCVRGIIELATYNAELTEYMRKCNEFENGLRKSWPTV